MIATELAHGEMRRCHDMRQNTSAGSWRLAGRPRCVALSSTKFMRLMKGKWIACHVYGKRLPRPSVGGALPYVKLRCCCGASAGSVRESSLLECVLLAAWCLGASPAVEECVSFACTTCFGFAFCFFEKINMTDLSATDRINTILVRLTDLSEGSARCWCAQFAQRKWAVQSRCVRRANHENAASAASCAAYGHASEYHNDSSR